MVRCTQTRNHWPALVVYLSFELSSEQKNYIYLLFELLFGELHIKDYP